MKRTGWTGHALRLRLDLHGGQGGVEGQARGSVTPVQRRAIVSRIIQSFAWNEL